jgi:hypothetical protein
MDPIQKRREVPTQAWHFGQSEHAYYKTVPEKTDDLGYVPHLLI